MAWHLSPRIDKAVKVSTKKADPATESTLTNVPADNTAIRIACPYERRLLAALILRPHSRRELDDAIGTTNSAEYVRRFRRRGLSIITTRAYGLNRDGRQIWRGIYHILRGDRGRVLDALGGAIND